MKAGALYYALFVSLLILIVLSVILLASVYQKQNLRRLWDDVRLNENIESAANLALSADPEGFDGEFFDLFGEGRDSVSVDYSEWGVFGLLKISAKKSGLRRSRAYLTGLMPSKDFVIMRRSQSPLNISGVVSLTGKVNFQPGLLQERVFEGVFPQAEFKVRYSEVNPGVFMLNSDFLDTAKRWLNGAAGESSDYAALSTVHEKLMSRSFFDSTMVFYETGDVYLEDFNLSGNIIVFSKGSIFVDKNTQLKDVRLYGEKIVVQDGFKGTAQFFASHSLSVGEGCLLDYPSLLAVFSPYKENEAKIYVDKQTIVHGALILKNVFDDTTDTRSSEFGIIENYGHIKGLVFSEAFVEQKGRLDGTVICNDFIFRNSSGVYKSHLINAEINEMDSGLLWPVVFEESGKQKIIDWMH